MFEELIKLKKKNQVGEIKQKLVEEEKETRFDQILDKFISFEIQFILLKYLDYFCIVFNQQLHDTKI